MILASIKLINVHAELKLLMLMYTNMLKQLFVIKVYIQGLKTPTFLIISFVLAKVKVSEFQQNTFDFIQLRNTSNTDHYYALFAFKRIKNQV